MRLRTIKYVQIQVAVIVANDHFSTLRPKSAGDLLDTSCTLCECKKSEEWRFNLHVSK